MEAMEVSAASRNVVTHSVWSRRKQSQTRSQSTRPCRSKRWVRPLVLNSWRRSAHRRIVVDSEQVATSRPPPASKVTPKASAKKKRRKKKGCAEDDEVSDEAIREASLERKSAAEASFHLKAEIAQKEGE